MRKLASSVWLVLILLAPLAVYAWYVALRLDRIHEQNQRELAHSAEILEKTIRTAITNVQNLKERRSLDEFRREQTYLEQAGRFDEETLPVSEPELKSTGDGLEISREKLRFRLRLDRVLDELSFPESFQVILLADQDGRVRFEFSTNRKSWRKRYLRQSESRFTTEMEGVGDGVRIVDLDAVTTPAGKKLELAEKRGASSLFRVRIGGADHHLYMQPLRLPLRKDANQAETSWHVGGLVPVEQLSRRAFAVDDALFLVLALLVVVSLLGWPFLKLASMEAHERLRRFDVSWMNISTAALVALATILIFAMDGYLRLSASCEDSLRTLGADMNERLTAELKAVRNQLAAYDHAMTLQPSDNRQTRLLEDGSKRVLGLGMPEHYSGLRQVAWTRADGMQIAKATTLAETTDMVNLSRRVYFQAASEGFLWRFRGEDKAARPFFVTSDRSITNGQFYTFVSMRSARKDSTCEKGGQTACAVAMTLDLTSMGSQPLTYGTGFALIDRSGDVLYHSDGRLARRENLYDDVSDSFALKAAALAGQPVLLDLTYRTANHKFFILPVRDVVAPDSDGPIWFLVVFRDLSVYRAVAGRAVLLSLVACVALLPLWLALMGAGQLASRRVFGHASAWLWPHERDEGQTARQNYGPAILALAGALALTAVVHLGRDGPASFFIGVAITVAGAWLALRLYLPRQAKLSHAVATQRSAWHHLGLFGLLLLVGAVPAFSALRLFWNSEFGRLARYESFRFEELRADIEASYRAKVREWTSSEDVRNGLLEQRRKFLIARLEPWSAPAPVAPDPGFLANWLPPQSDYMASWLQQAPAQLGPGSRIGGVFPGPWTWLALLATAALLIWWIDFHSRWLFLSELQPSQAQASHVREASPTWFPNWWSESPKDEKLVLVQVAEEGFVNPRQHAALTSLFRRGMLVLEPHLDLSRPDFADFVRQEAQKNRAEIQEWERPQNSAGWRQMRWVMLGAVLLTSLFLFLTQPDLPAEVMGGVSAIATVVTGAAKVREVVGGWARSKAESADAKTTSG